jgi:hypothetical protein
MQERFFEKRRKIAHRRPLEDQTNNGPLAAKLMSHKVEWSNPRETVEHGQRQPIHAAPTKERRTKKSEKKKIDV